MNLKINKQLLNDLNNIAEMEYSTTEAVLIRGLILYAKYAQGLNLTGYFKGEEGIKGAEKYIEDLAATYCTDTNEIVFACIDAYRAKVIGETIEQRFESSGRDEIYLFVEDPFRGNILCTYSKENNTNEFRKIMALKREEDKIEREETLKGFIENAKEKLSQAEKELKQLEKDYEKANSDYTKVSNEHRILSVTEIFKFTAEQRMDHKNKLENKKGKLSQIAVKTTMLGQELESKRHEVIEIKNDINTMNSYFNFDEVPIWKAKGKYNSNPEVTTINIMK